MKRNLFVAALTLCCSVLMFNAQPAMAATATKVYEYSPDISAPAPADLATRVDGLSQYLVDNGTNNLCYLVIDYGANWSGANHMSWNDGEWPSNWYIDYFYVGTKAPAARYLYLYYVNDMQYNGGVVSGASKYLFAVNNSISPTYKSCKASSEITVYGQPLAAVWYSENGDMTVAQNTFGSAAAANTSSYTVYFGRSFNCTSRYDDSARWYTLDYTHPVLLGIHDNHYDVSQSSVYAMQLCSSSITKMGATANPAPTLDGINFTVKLPVPIGVVLGDFGAVLTSSFGFVSDTVILLCEYPVILVLLCIPLVGLAIGLFKSFTSR